MFKSIIVLFLSILRLTSSINASNSIETTHIEFDITAIRKSSVLHEKKYQKRFLELSSLLVTQHRSLIQLEDDLKKNPEKFKGLDNHECIDPYLNDDFKNAIRVIAGKSAINEVNAYILNALMRSTCHFDDIDNPATDIVNIMNAKDKLAKMDVSDPNYTLIEECLKDTQERVRESLKVSKQSVNSIRSMSDFMENPFLKHAKIKRDRKEILGKLKDSEPELAKRLKQERTRRKNEKRKKQLSVSPRLTTKAINVKRSNETTSSRESISSDKSRSMSLSEDLLKFGGKSKNVKKNSGQDERLGSFRANVEQLSDSEITMALE